MEQQQQQHYHNDNNNNNITRRGKDQHRIWPHHESISDCIPSSPWQHFSFPICNVVHGLDMQDVLISKAMNLLSTKGFWRDTWKINIYHRDDDDDNDRGFTIELVLKTFKYVSFHVSYVVVGPKKKKLGFVFLINCFF
jgi:hypothetical protein